MRFFDFFGQRDRSVSYGAVLDIRSGSIGIGIVESDTHKSAPSLIHSERLPLHTAAQESADRVGALREGLRMAHAHLASDGRQALVKHAPGADISQMVAVCGSPWSVTIPRTLAHEQKEPVTITRKLIRQLTKDAEKAISAELAEAEKTHAFDFTATERAIIGAQVNGYAVRDPEGLTGTSVQCSQVAGFVAKEIMDALKQIQAETFDGVDVRVYTYLLGAYCAAQELRIAADAAWIIDITRETVEVGIVEEHMFTDALSAPAGSEMLIRSICEKQKAPRDDVRTQLQNYVADTLSPEARQRLTPHLADYRNTLQKTIGTIADAHFVPGMVILTAETEMQDILVQLLTEAFKQAAARPPCIATLTEQELGRLTEGAADVHLAIAGHLLHDVRQGKDC